MKILIGACLALWAVLGFSQGYPAKPVKIIVPLALARWSKLVREANLKVD